jgi:LL-diaminopimelate aminotransferase
MRERGARAAARLTRLPPNHFRELSQLKAQLAREGRTFIDLSEGIPDLPPHPRLLNYLARSCARTDVHSYTQLPGSSSLRAALREYLRAEFGVERDDIGMLPGAGAKELIAHVCQAVLGDGDVALIPEIGYPLYRVAVEYAGGVPVSYPLRAEDGWRPDLARLAEPLLARARIIFLNYPHNPTGAALAQEELDALVQFCRARSILVCLDLAYSHIYFGGLGQRDHGGAAPGALRNAGKVDGILELHTFSKSLGLPGWRAAFAAGDPDLIELLETSRAVFSTGPSVLLQKALRYGLLHFREFARGLDVYRRRVSAAVAQLTAEGVAASTPAGTFFLWLRLPGPGSASQFARSLVRERQVLVMPGAPFGEREDRHVRVALTAPSEVLDEAIGRITSHIRGTWAGDAANTAPAEEPCRI